jgi:DNA-binding CsgD family transcriptional regulator
MVDKMLSEFAACGGPSVLTARERQMMALAAEGYSNQEIAEKLFLSPLTVRTHIQRAMMKLHARDRAQVVVSSLPISKLTSAAMSSEGRSTLASVIAGVSAGG